MPDKKETAPKAGSVDYGLHEWPKDFMPAVNVALAYYRGDDPDLDLKEAAHAGWHLLGYVGGQMDPHVVDNSPKGAVHTNNPSKKAKIEALESLQSSSADPNPNVKKALPWALLLSIGMELIKLLLKK